MKQSLSIKIILAVLMMMTFVNIFASEPEKVKIQEIFKTDHAWNGQLLPKISGQTEVRMVTFTVKPGGRTSIHQHPINGVGYIVEGELILVNTSDPSGDFSDVNKVKKVTLKAGDSWAETVNEWHYGENISNKDVKWIVAYVGEKGSSARTSLG